MDSIMIKCQVFILKCKQTNIINLGNKIFFYNIITVVLKLSRKTPKIYKNIFPFDVMMWYKNFTLHSQGFDI